MQIKDNVFLFPRRLASASWRALEEGRGEGSVAHGSDPLPGWWEGPWDQQNRVKGLVAS